MKGVGVSKADVERRLREALEPVAQSAVHVRWRTVAEHDALDTRDALRAVDVSRWMLRFRRLVTRYECHARDFYAFTKLACIVILARTARPTRKAPSRSKMVTTRLSDAF